MEKKLLMGFVGIFMLLVYPKPCSPEQTYYLPVSAIIQNSDTGELNEEQKNLLRQELEIYQASFEPLKQTDLKAWSEKVKELFRKLSQGLTIYNLSQRNPDLKSKVREFTEKTKVDVYILSYVEDAFLNNIFYRLAEARYDVIKKAHVKMKYRFQKNPADSSSKFSVKLELVYDSALVALLKTKLANGYKEYSDLTLEASANKELEKAGIQDIFSDAAAENTALEPTAEDILDKLASANVEAEEEDYLLVNICDSLVKDEKIYYWKKDCVLKVQLLNKDTLNEKEISLGLKINATSPKSEKDIPYVIKNFATFNILKLDSLPEGKYTLTATVNKKPQKKCFYLRKTKHDYACVKCGRDLTVTLDLLDMMSDEDISFTTADATLLTKLLKKAGFNNCKSQAHFFSQSCHETLGFTRFVEMVGFSMNGFYNSGFKSNCNVKLMFNQSFWDEKTYKQYFSINNSNSPLFEESNDQNLVKKYAASELKKYIWGSKKQKNSVYASCNLESANAGQDDTIKIPVKIKLASDIPEGSIFYAKYFLTKAEEEACGKKLYSLLYATLMGNGNAATEDGYNYRGRGMVHLTGKDNYSNVSTKCNSFFQTSYDFVSNYEKVTTDANQIIYSAVAFYLATPNLLNTVKTGSCKSVTKIVNGGYNGYNTGDKYSRLTLFLKYKKEIYYDCDIEESE